MYMYLYMYTYVHMCVHCVCAYVYAYTYMYIYVCMYVCVYVDQSICVYTCVCIVYAHTCVRINSRAYVHVSIYVPPKNGLIALLTPRTSRLSTFYFCQVVNRALLRLLSTYI